MRLTYMRSIMLLGAYGERLCKSAPEIGVKALELALKDAGFASTL